MKQLMLDFNQLEQKVKQGDYQGLKGRGSKDYPIREFQNGQRNRKALYHDLRTVFMYNLGIFEWFKLSQIQREYITRTLNVKLNEINHLKGLTSQERQLAFVRAVREHVAHGKFFYFIFEKELKNIYFKEIIPNE